MSSVRYKHRIVVIDDHPSVRLGLRTMINAQSDMVVVGEATDTMSGLDALSEHRPDVVLVDINMPGASGLEIVARARLIVPSTVIIVVTQHHERHWVERAKNQGARGYVSKIDAIENMPKAIRQCLAGKFYISHELATEIAADALHEENDEILAQLSQREYEVFRMLGQGISIGEIAGRLSLSDKTVSTYRGRITEKLGHKTPAETIYAAMQYMAKKS